MIACRIAIALLAGCCGSIVSAQICSGPSCRIVSPPPIVSPPSYAGSRPIVSQPGPIRRTIGRVINPQPNQANGQTVIVRPAAPWRSPYRVDEIAKQVAENPALVDRLASDPRLRGPAGTPGQSPSIDYSRVAADVALEFAINPEFADQVVDRLAGDPRLQGPAGAPGQTPVIDYDRLAARVASDQVMQQGVGSQVSGSQPVREAIAATARDVIGRDVGWLDGLKSFIVGTGLNYLIPGGAAGMLALRAFSLWINRRRRPQPPRPPPASPLPTASETEWLPPADDAGHALVDDPPPPESPPVESRRQYVRVPVVDQKREALELAMQRVTERNPEKFEPTVRLIRSVAGQILHGNQVQNARGKKGGGGIGWMDDPEAVL